MTDPQATEDLVNQIRPLLAGKPPDVIGVALADCTATYFAGHHPDIRNEALHLFMALIRGLIPLAEEEIKRQRGTENPWSLQ